jgi:predicted MFS family arabinose efflux permease
MKAHSARRATQAYFLLSGIAMATWAALIPSLKLRLELSDSQLGSILLVFGLGAIFMTPLAGRLVKRWGSHRMLALSGMVTTLLLPLLALADTLQGLGAELFLFGAASGLAGVSSNTQGLQVQQALERPVMSSFHALFSVGGLVGALGCSLLLNIGMRWGILSTLITALLFGLALWQYPQLLPPDEQPGPRKTQPWRWPSGQLWLLSLMAFCCYLSEGAMLDWSAVFLHFERGLPEHNAAWGYAVFACAMAVGRLWGDRWVTALGATRVIAGGSGLAAGGMLLFVLSPHPVGSLAGCFLIGIGAANLVPTLVASGALLPGRNPEANIAWIVTLGYIGIIAGPGLVGFAAEAIGLHLALMSLAGLLLWVAAVAQRSQSRMINREPDTPC